MTEQNPHIPSDASPPTNEIHLAKSLVHTTVQSKHIEDVEHADADRPNLARIIFYALLLGVAAIFLYLVMENPVLPYLNRRFFDFTQALTWSGLVVKSSTVLLVVFLLVVLLRFVFQMIFAFLHSVRYTFGINRQVEDFLPPISVIVPAYNEGKLIKTTLSSLVALNYPKFEIIVVDDGSTDNTRHQVEDFITEYEGKTVIRLVSKPNGGKATALNAGVQVAIYNYVLCADGDSNLTPDTLRKAIRHFRDPKIGAVSGNVKVANRHNIWTILQALEYVEGLNLARQAQSFFRLVNIIPGPVGLFRKDVIQDVGWYSSDTFAEDCDISLKILRKGWRIVYEPKAISWTEAPNTLGMLYKQRYRWTRGILQAIRKNKRQEWKSLSAWMLMWLMVLEAFILPFMNIFATLYFLYVALFFNVSYYLVFWWIGLTLLDLAAALYAVTAEREEIRLVFYAFLYRLFFVLVIDICKVLATIEEFLGFHMSWGKLERIGAEK